ncbi:hypothetical protein ABE61_00340 [Lysinibacillus sphaericus]|nr:hypothetical protein [Lysinibacillus sphaericus]MBG9476957.1 hypothetical protein [Lysinibacillus sphaericus]MBG9592726.1 hypothetical protein [Lysinibacillus sphaericus]
MDRTSKIVDRTGKVVDRAIKNVDRADKMHDRRAEVTAPAWSHLFYLKNFIKVKPFHRVIDSKY